MVFSRLLALSGGGDRGGSSRATTAAQQQQQQPSSTKEASSNSRQGPAAIIPPEYIWDETHLPPPPPQAPDLRDLNSCLEALSVVFPDVQVDVFREMLVSFDGESRLALVADALLKNKVTWVKGRWRVAEPARPSSSSSTGAGRRPARRRGDDSLLRPHEIFRSAEYKAAVLALARHEFKGLSRSAVNAVLAECNYSYLDARPTLVDLSSKTWSFALSSLFRRKRPVTASEAENHPLVVWKSSGLGSIIPCLRSTGNAELDRELFDALIVPLRERARAAQVDKDRALAASFNAEEAERLNETYDCACCFTSGAFEEFVSCSADGHLVCLRCVSHSITEAVFGQGWLRTIDAATGTLRCPAVESTECAGRISSQYIQRALLEEPRGAEILHKFDQRLAEHNLVSSQLPLVRCPFCSYAEVDDVYVPRGEASQLRLRIDSLGQLVLLLACLALALCVAPFLLLSTAATLLLGSRRTPSDYVAAQWTGAIQRYRRRRRGPRFQCRAPDCRRPSCLLCGKEWADVHVCHESSLVALRTQVEQAMSMAIKRVCPRCNTSFVKSAGCNKLTCPCGYKMCYVCRKDIGGDGDGSDVGYRHFCDHFRPEGDPRPCTQCDRCNLWESENTELVLRRAREEAERKWREAENRELSDAEKTFLESGVAVGQGAGLRSTTEKVLRRGTWPSVPEVFDVVVENLFL